MAQGSRLWASARLTPVRGREHETELLRSALDRHAPLVTITGPSGIGKSRLAEHVAPDAVTFDASRIQGSGGFDELVERVLLVVVDHDEECPCNIVLDGLDTEEATHSSITSLIDRHPQLQLIITRRSPLDVHGELIVRVGPLELPTQTGQVLHQSDQWPAVQCFLDHARLADPAFEVTHQNAHDTLVALRSTGGLPLAIELTARWLHLVPIGELAARATHLLTSTSAEAGDLRSALARTANHLSASQLELATAFAQLHGPAEIGIVEHIRGADVDLADVRVLANLGLISRVERDEGAWFVMNPITARFLGEEHPAPDQRRRYQLWLLNLVDTNAPDLVTLNGARAMAALHPYVSRLPALPTVFDDPDELGRITVHLSAFWELAVQHHEGARQLEAAGSALQELHPLSDWIALLGARFHAFIDDETKAERLLRQSAQQADPAVRLLSAIELALVQAARHEPPQSELLNIANELWSATGERANLPHSDLKRRWNEIPARLLLYRGARASLLGDREDAVRLFEEASKTATSNGNTFQHLGILQAIAFELANLRETERAAEVLNELDAHARLLNSALDTFSVTLLRSAMESQRGQFRKAAAGIQVALDKAEPFLYPRFVHYWRLASALALAEDGVISGPKSLFRRSLRAAQATDNDSLTAFTLASVVGANAPFCPPTPTAGELMAVARRLHPRPLPPIAGPWEERAVMTPMRDSVLTAQEALTVALKHLDSIPQGRRMSALTTRENEVLALVAEGLTDRDIAGRLYISVRTANTHVAAIIRKLGVSSRREAAERYRAEQDRGSSAPE